MDLRDLCRGPQRYRGGGRSKNFGEGVVIGRHNLPPGWDRVNWSAKIWGRRAPPAPPFRPPWTELWPQLMHPGLWLLKCFKSENEPELWLRPWPQSFLLQRYVHSSKEVPCPGLYTLLTYTSQFLPPLNQFLAPHVSVPTLSFNMAHKKIGY